MKIYVAQPEKLATPKTKWMKRFAYFTLYFVVHFLISLPWWSRGESFLERIAGSAFFAFFMTVFQSTAMKYAPGINEVHIDQEGINVPMGRLKGRSIRFDEVKSVVETKANLFRGAGLLLSKHGVFGRFFWGGVWVPARLDDYAEAKAIIASKVRPTVSWAGRPTS